MKKIISILLGISLICTLFVSVSASGETGVQLDVLESELMYGLGIVDDSVNLEANATKGKLAEMVYRLINREYGENYEYTTVDYNFIAEEYFDESATEFNLQSDITLDTAVKVLLKMSGYESYANVKGIKNAAYLLGILDGCSIEDNNALKLKELLKLYYNTLMLKGLDLIAVTSSGKNQYERDSRETVLSLYTDIYMGKGLVTANQYTNLYRESTLYSAGEMEINNIRYTGADERYMSCIGRNVKFFYKDASEPVVIAMAEDKSRNNVLTVDFDDVKKIDTTSCVYKDEGEKQKTIKFQRGFDYILNNRVMENRVKADMQIADGNFTFIDNNNDNKFDVVVAEKCETLKLTGIDYYNDIYFSDERIIETDLFNESYYQYIYILDEDGVLKKGEFDEVSVDSIISVYQSEDKRYLRVYAANAQITGVVDDYDKFYAVIGGEKHEFADKNIYNYIIIGLEYEFRIDAFGRIVCPVDEDAIVYKYKYGYLYDLEPEGRATYSTRVLTSEGGKIYNIAKTFNLDGAKKKSSEIETTCLFNGNGKYVRQLIRFIEKDGEIRAIDTLTTDKGGERDRLEKSYEKTSMTYYPGFGIFDGKGRTTSDTFVIAIPELEDEQNDWENYNLFYSFHSDPTAYSVELYDVNDKLEIGAVLVYPAGSVNTAKSTNGDTAVGVIKKIYYSCVDDEVKTVLRFQTNSGEVDYCVNEEYFPTGINCGFGDVVRYVLDRNKEIVTLFVELEANGKELTELAPKEDVNGYYQFFYGRVNEKFSDYITMYATRDTPDASGNPVLRVVPLNTKQVIIVDTKNEEITIGSSSNISATINNGSYVYIRSYRYNTANHVVVYQ